MEFKTKEIAHLVCRDSEPGALNFKVYDQSKANLQLPTGASPGALIKINQEESGFNAINLFKIY